MRSNSKSPSFWLKMQVIEVIIHEYAHEMDYAHIKLDLIYQELPVKDWHLWQGFSWKNAKLVVYVALTLFSDLRSGSWQGQWAIDHLMFSESHKLYIDGMLLVRGMVRRMGIMNPSYLPPQPVFYAGRHFILIIKSPKMEKHTRKMKKRLSNQNVD